MPDFSDLPPELRSNISFAIAVFVEDQEKSIRKQGLGRDHYITRRASDLEKFRLLALNPSALCGKLTLPSGEVIMPGQEWKP